MGLGCDRRDLIDSQGEMLVMWWESHDLAPEPVLALSCNGKGAHAEWPVRSEEVLELLCLDLCS